MTRDDATGCLLWTGANVRGYGQIKVGRTLVYTHRLAWELAHGPIPDGMTVDHLCRRRPCCEPTHLQLTSLRRNIQRAAVENTGQGCRRGHRWDAGNAYIDAHGVRHCRTCRRAADQRWRQRQRERASGLRVAAPT